MGRRVEKKVYSGSTGNWTLNKHLKFVYNDYEQIEELDGLDNNAIRKKRLWGLDKLLCDIHGSTAYYALGDANKNITEYLDDSGNIQAHYEYSPFGKTTAKTGTKQNDFDFRFSCEVFDSETATPSNDRGGLVYYNFRYYSPDLGRWLSRDPIEEEGGWNLYGMVGNNPIINSDYLGKEPFTVIVICGVTFYVFYKAGEIIYNAIDKVKKSMDDGENNTTTRSDMINNPTDENIDNYRNSMNKSVGPGGTASELGRAGANIPGTGMQEPPATPSTNAVDAALTVAGEIANKLNK